MICTMSAQGNDKVSFNCPRTGRSSMVVLRTFRCTNEAYKPSAIIGMQKLVLSNPIAILQRHPSIRLDSSKSSTVGANRAVQGCPLILILTAAPFTKRAASFAGRLKNIIVVLLSSKMNNSPIIPCAPSSINMSRAIVCCFVELCCTTSNENTSCFLGHEVFPRST